MKYSTVSVAVLALIGLVSAGVENERAPHRECSFNRGPGYRGDKEDITREAHKKVGDFEHKYMKNCITPNEVAKVWDENSENLVDKNASNSAAHYESCKIGERIIPAKKVESQIEQASNFCSNQKGQYALKGEKSNDYTLKGSIAQENDKKYTSVEEKLNNLSLAGSIKKKY